MTNNNQTMTCLTPYVLTNERIIKIVNNNFYNVKKKQTNIKDKKQTKTNINFYTPDVKDGLFWSFYIVYNSLDNYELLSRTKFKEERDFKINFINQVKSHKVFFKKLKVKYNHVENRFINEEKIDLQSFLVLCAYYKVNIILLNQKIYYKFNFSDTSSYSIFQVNNDNKISIDYSKNNDSKFDYYEKNLVEVNPLRNDLFAISYYKQNELLCMANKLQIDVINNKTQKNKKKDLLYSDIRIELNKYILRL